MKLRTTIPLPKEALGFDLFGGMVFVGSCFSDNIGSKLTKLGLPTVVNPFGVIFHPTPLLRLIEHALDAEFSYSKANLVEHQGVFYSLDHHGTFKHADSSALIENLNVQLTVFREGLASSSSLFLTLGTAWGYSYQNEIVANCHKLPMSLFKKSLSSYPDLKTTLNSVVKSLASKYPHLNVVLTVSPIRHIKNGIVDDSRSKSLLITAVNDVVDTNKNTYYFPSFELMMDDLRDYRFYKDDLIHPSEMAIDYIFNYFNHTFFLEKEQEVIAELGRFLKLHTHKIMDVNSPEARTLENKVMEKKSELQRKFPKITFIDQV